MVDVSRDSAIGERRQEQHGDFKAHSEAQNALHEAITKVESGQFRWDGKLTVAAFLKEWLTNKSRDVRPSTITDNRRHIEKGPHSRTWTDAPAGTAHQTHLRTAEVAKRCGERRDHGSTYPCHLEVGFE